MSDNICETCSKCELLVQCDKNNNSFGKWFRKKMPKLWRFIKNL